jgi:hypothetical protein
MTDGFARFAEVTTLVDLLLVILLFLGAVAVLEVVGKEDFVICLRFHKFEADFKIFCRICVQIGVYFRFVSYEDEGCRRWHVFFR